MRRLLPILLCAAAPVLFAGCGNKGPLYRPPARPAASAAPASAASAPAPAASTSHPGAAD